MHLMAYIEVPQDVGKMGWDNTRFHLTIPNWEQFEIHELFISGIFLFPSVNSEVGKGFCAFAGEFSAIFLVPLSLSLLLVIVLPVSRLFPLGQISKL